LGSLFLLLLPKLQVLQSLQTLQFVDYDTFVKNGLVSEINLMQPIELRRDFAKVERSP